MKTDPRPYQFVYVGPATLILAAEFDGLSVLTVTGGEVTRAGTALGGGDMLASGDVLSITPSRTGGTVTLSCEQANQEFSGRFADLDGLSVNITTDPPTLVYRRGDGVSFELALMPSPVPQETYTLGSWIQIRNDVPGGAIWICHLDLIPSTVNTGMHLTSGTITGLPMTADWMTFESYPQVSSLPPYQFVKIPQDGDPGQRSVDLYLTIPLGVTPENGLVVTFTFQQT